MSELTKGKINKIITPLYGNLFEIEFKSHKVDTGILTHMIAGYDLKSSEKKIIVHFDAVEESLSTLMSTLDKIEHIRILLHDINDSVFMAIDADIKYIGLELSQRYLEDGLLKIGVSFSTSNIISNYIERELD